MVAGAQADQWQATGSAGSSAVYDDNPRLLDVGSESAFGLVTDASLELKRQTERSKLGLSPRVVARRYTGDYALDSDDIYLDLDYSTRTSERSEYSLRASYSRDGTLTSEFVPTGFVPANVSREVAEFSAAANRSVSERAGLFGSATYQDVRYDDGLRYGLLDYRYWSGLGLLQRSLSERTSVSLVARIGLLDVPLTRGESQEVTVGLGLDRSWSERWKSSFYVGPTFSEVNGRSSGTNTSYRADLTGEWERSALRVQAERLLSPDAGRGQLESRDRASASVTHGLSEYIEASVTATIDYFSEADDPRNRGGRYRTYGRAVAGLVWRFSPQWSATTRLEYAHRDDFTSASRSSLMAGIEWRARPRTLFR
jgi:hypothetical protein